MRLFSQVLLLIVFSYVLYFVPKNVYAEETGFRFPTTCQTNGSSCDNMRTQDINYNSWINKGYEEIKATFTDFGVPTDAVIEEIQIKLRVRVSGTANFWLVHFPDDEGNTWYLPNYCTPISPSSCKYTPRSSFNSISSPTFTWLNTNKQKKVTGAMLNDPNFVIRLSENNQLQNTDIDTLLFNIKYHLPDPSPPPILPPGYTAYLITSGFTALPNYSKGVFFFDSIGFSNFKAGDRIILSSKPDGTGDIQVADAIQINNPFHSFYFDASPLCIPLIMPLPAKDISSYLSVNYPTLSISIRDNCLRTKIIGPIYLVHIQTTSAPTPTPIPTPTSPEPFLDLPWDYEAKGLTFNEAALSMSSYFDHEYPLLSSGLTEPSGTLDDVVKFSQNKKVDDFYSSHDGYDWAKLAKVNLDDPVLAAAAGWATFKSNATSGGGGNVIKIDHENGYQTWYEHLDINDLIINAEGQRVYVSQGQMIGRVGMTGRTTGAHIHFSVFQDKNNDGNFDDNIPDGATDPFGWQSTEEDPWEHYSFIYSGQQRTGNKSYYLWKKKISGLNSNLTSNGGIFKNERYDFNFPANSTNQNLTLEFISQPIVKVSKILNSIGSTIQATAKDTLGNIVTQFNNPFTLTIDFANFDLSNINLDTLSIYSSQDGINWNKEITDVDLLNSKASSQIIHFTYFALMGEKKDIIAPTTSPLTDGLKGEENWFRSDVLLSLNADDGSGIGADYIIYKKDGSDWETYSTPITFSEEGNHKIEFYSVDKAENIEEVKSFEFNIDETPPALTFSMLSGDVPYTSSWTNSDVLVSFSCEDNQSGVATVSQPLLVSSEGENQKVTGECTDKAGNKTTREVAGINIDKTNPEAEIRYKTDLRDLEINSKDISPVVITKSKLSKNTEQIVLTDSVGYTLKIIAEKKRKIERKETEIDFEIKKIEYNDTPSLNLIKNKLSIQDKIEHLRKELKQSFTIKDEVKIRMEYESKKNETKVITKVKGEEKIKEKLSGIRILKLFTERGNLKYGY
jgi:murein DD-endopeptidase MepM/ murein hydrolase activator NlpD